MRYTMSINAVKCQEWGLNINQGALFDLINQASSWANSIVINGEVYYWVSRHMIIEEIPIAYSKTDTVYRAFKDLVNKGLIEHIKQGQKDLIRLTEKGKQWNAKNSEINPTFSQKLGNKSEKSPKNSEIDPTDHNTKNHNTNYQGTRTHSQKIEPVKNSQKSKTQKSKTQKSNSMTKPTIEQVTKYFAEKKHPTPATEAEHWLDYYTANGWKIGKNPMQDWKAAIRNWMRHDNQAHTGDQNHATHQPNQSTYRQSSADRYEQMLAQQLSEDRQRSVRDVF